jgi:hypothetical protein
MKRSCLVPGLDLPKIAGSTGRHRPCGGVRAFERVRGHPIINGIDVALVDHLPVATGT